MAKTSTPPKTNVPVASKTGEKKIRKKRKKRDPNAPKRAMTAFIYFSNEMRHLIRNEDPSLSITEVAKRLGALWRETEDKSKWNEMAAKDKIRAVQERETYLADLKNST